MEHQNHPEDFVLKTPHEQKVLNLYNQGLRDLPAYVWEASQLEVLNLGNNDLSTLPEVL
jgi:Leucine-rich repeat (LRR) protein